MNRDDQVDDQVDDVDQGGEDEPLECGQCGEVDCRCGYFDDGPQDNPGDLVSAARPLVGVDGFESDGPADRVSIVLRPVPSGPRLFLELDAIGAREWGYAIARRAEAIIEAENESAATLARLYSLCRVRSGEAQR